MTTLALSKLQGLGNDFLILVDPDRSIDVTAATAAALCERHLGVGADGFVRLSRGRDRGHGSSMRFELWNADGSAAETSGNGLSCAAVVAVDAGLATGPVVELDTAAGLRRATLSSAAGQPGGDGGAREVAVEMGSVQLGPEVEAPLPGLRARTAEVGNPHLVLVGPGARDLELVAFGTRMQDVYAGGINVEAAEPISRSELEMAVFERGAGLTMACGSGSCAVAAAARAWGLAGDEVVVRNPGGDLRVALSGGDPELAAAVLTVPVRKVAEVGVDLADLGLERGAATAPPLAAARS